MSCPDLALIITADFETLRADIVTKVYQCLPLLGIYSASKSQRFQWFYYRFGNPRADEDEEVFGNSSWLCCLLSKYAVLLNWQLSQEKSCSDWNEGNCFIAWRFVSEAAQVVVKCKSRALKFSRVFTELHLWLCRTTKISCECANRPYENVLSPSICHFLTGLIGKHL